MSGVAPAPEGITNPPIDELLERTSSKYALVIYAAKRARQINDYYTDIHEGSMFDNVGPLVDATIEDKPLSVALHEIHADKLVLTHDEVTEACVGPLAPEFGGEIDQRLQRLPAVAHLSPALRRLRGVTHLRQHGEDRVRDGS